MNQASRFQAAELKETCDQQQPSAECFARAPIVGETKAAVSRLHYASVARMLKPVHTRLSRSVSP